MVDELISNVDLSFVASEHDRMLNLGQIHPEIYQHLTMLEESHSDLIQPSPEGEFMAGYHPQPNLFDDSEVAGGQSYYEPMVADQEPLEYWNMDEQI